MIEVRRARVEDAAAMRLLLESLAREAEPWVREVAIQLGEERGWIEGFVKDDREHVADGGKFLFFAFDGDRLVGHVNGVSWAHAPKGIFDRMMLEHGLEGERPGNVGIAVHKSYRRQGIGTRLMLKAINELREMRVTVVVAGVNVDNGPSLLFFDRMGFIVHRSEGKQVWVKRRITVTGDLYIVRVKAPSLSEG